VAEKTSAAVSGLGQWFMLDAATYATGAERGFIGIDFYFAGRAGVLGDVDSEIVSSALVFFEPDAVRAGWTGSRDVMSRHEAVQVFASCAARWAGDHLGDDLDWARLAELAAKIVDQASPAGAPLFAGWRGVPVPADPKVAALRQMNALRELRMARHGAAVIAVGLEPVDAVRHRSPHMVGIFGWEPAEVDGGVAELWAEAESLTDRATAKDYTVLDDAEADEFTSLCRSAVDAVT
jgi:hypothetical protein